ncbi:hypothetical protein HYT60_00290 [Candidatus Woesebacteria bacterium]|nr:hypothetical protein [Candidatus Woesebacteria bacterium]
MSKTILITRPNYEEKLNFLFFWSQTVVDLARKKNFVVLDLRSEKSNKKDFDSYIKKNNPSFVFFNGHGSARLITGHNDEPLVCADKDEDLLKDKIVYSRTCESALVLGNQCVKNGTKTFIGYISPFVFFYSKSSVLHPLGDDICRQFLEPTNLIAIKLLKGHTSREANEYSKIAMLKNVFSMLSSASTLGEKTVASFLWGNITSQVLIGNPNAMI